MSDEILNYIKDAVDRVEEKLDKHNDRLGIVEKWQSNADGKVTMFGLFCVSLGGILSWLTNLFHR